MNINVTPEKSEAALIQGDAAWVTQCNIYHQWVPPEKNAAMWKKTTEKLTLITIVNERHESWSLKALLQLLGLAHWEIFPVMQYNDC